MMLTPLVAAITFVGAAYFIFRRRRVLIMCSRIPFFTLVPIAGDILALLYYKFNIIKTLDLIKKGYGDCYAAWNRLPLVFVSRREDMEIIFTNPATQDRGDIFDGVGEFLGAKSLMVLDWNKAKEVKKTLHKSFMNSSQAIIFDNFRKSNKELLNLLPAEEGKWIKCLHLIKRATASAICGSALSLNIEDCPSFKELALHNMERLMFLSICRGLSWLHRFDFLYYHIFGWKKIAPLANEIDKDFSLFVSKKRDELSELKNNGKEVPNQYIYNLLQEERNNNSTDQVLADDIKTLLVTALDTSAVTAAFALLMLAIYPQYQQHVYEEVQRVERELNGEQLDERSIGKYEYLSRVIKETLRIYPPVPLIGRRVNEDTKFGKYTVPAGATIVGSVLSLHRDPSIYENPSVFDPDRFLPENVEKRPKYSFVPFAAGARSCPGSRYGLQSAIYLVSSVIRKYKVFTKYTSVEELDNNLEMVITINDVEGFPIRIERR